MGKPIFGTDGVRGVAELRTHPRTGCGHRPGRRLLSPRRPVVVGGTPGVRARCSPRRSRPASIRPVSTPSTSGSCPAGGSPISPQPRGQRWGPSSRRPTTRPRTMGSSCSRPAAPSCPTRRSGIEDRLRSPEARSKRRARHRDPFLRHDALSRYVSHLLPRLPVQLAGVEIAIDCANGAAFKAAPMLFDRLEADRRRVGRRARRDQHQSGCGSTHPEIPGREANGRIGLAFDGDADRLLAFDEDGRWPTAT